MRPRKKVVEFFPHYVTHGKTLPIIQKFYGNDAYVLFFKMLELLGKMEGHFYHFGSVVDKDWFFSEVCVEEEKGKKILDKLAELGSIDKELWERGIIWSDNFVNRDLAIVYARRSIKVDKPDPEKFSSFYNKKINENTIKSRVEESRVESEKTITPVIAAITPVNVTETPVNVTITKKKTDRAKTIDSGDAVLYDKFRKKYPGTKRGLETEFKDFQKHKDWKEVLPQLEGILDRQIEHRKHLEERRKKDRNILIPFWKHLKTWTNQRCWEEETELPEGKDDKFKMIG